MSGRTVHVNDFIACKYFVLYVMVIVGTVAANKGHNCFDVNVEATVHKCSC